MKRARWQEHDDGGMATVLVALVMVALLVFAAFAIDVGNSYAAKRQTQSAADEGALAGGVESLQTGNIDQIVAKAKQFASDNSLTPISAAAWSSCTDSAALAVSSLTLSPTQGTPCISFGTGSTGSVQMRVRVPDVEMKTYLATVIGVKKIDHHAAATVSIGTLGGGAFPSSVFANQAAGDQVCLVNGPNGHMGICTDSTMGQFGTFNPWYYGINCTSGNTGDNIARAIALGLDHQLFVGPAPATMLEQGSADRLNASPCTQMFPNTVTRNTGFDSAQAITAGLILGGDSPGAAFSGRLAGGEYADGAHSLNAARLANTSIDNVPLWYFFKSSVKNDSGAAMPVECRTAAKMSIKRSVQNAIDVQVQDGVYKDFATGTRYASPEDLMSGCLSKWTPDAGTLFDESIGTTTRLGSVPKFWETVAGPASSVYHIKQFVPVYLQALVGKSTGSSEGPIHYAGDPMGNGVANNSYWNRSPSQDKKAVEGLGAVVIPCGALPSSICTTPNGQPGSVGGSMQQVRLSQ